MKDKMTMKKTIALMFVITSLLGGNAIAALLDSFGSQRVQTITITCDSGPTTPCRVEVVRARSLLPAAQAEADAAGISVSAITDAVIVRSATRAQINNFISVTSP